MAYKSHLRKERSGSTGGLWSRKSTYTPPPDPPLGSLLSTIRKEDLISESEKHISSARITDCEYVASFNWRDWRKPSLFVPGRPPRWTPVKEPKRLPFDNREYPLDRNGYHFPKHPFEATALSVLHAQPEPPKTAIDIVCSSRSLGYLISFCLEHDFREFRSLVEVVGGTVHILKRDNAPDEMLSNVKGYGHRFPEANTTWDFGTAGSTSHQRVVRYNLGGLNILLRGEIDGYLPEHTSPGTPSREKVSVDELADGLGSSSLSPKAVDPTSSTVTIKEAGSPVPQSSLFDLKTRSELRRGDDVLGEQLPRLWRSQIPNFVLAFHERGLFHDVSVQNVRGRIDKWEKDNTERIAAVIALLRRIVKVVTARPDRKVEIRATLDSEIEVRELLPDAGDVLSPSVREKWAHWLQNGRPAPATARALLPAKDDGDSEGNGSYSSGNEAFWYSYHSDDNEEPDFTACGADSCGYCGRCSY